MENMTMVLGGMWKSWEVWTRKVVDCSQQSLASLSSRSLEDNSAVGGGSRALYAASRMI